MKRSLVVLLPFLAACASGGAMAPPAAELASRPVDASQVLAQVGGHVWQPTGRVTEGIAALAAEDALDQLRSRAASLGLDWEDAREEPGLFLASGRLRGQLADLPLSAYLACGTKALTSVDIADIYPLDAVLVVSLAARTGPATRVQLQLRARARGTTSERGRPIICSSTGRLEEWLLSSLGPD